MNVITSNLQPGTIASDPDPVLPRQIESERPPNHLLLGSDALRLVREKLSALGEEIDAWETVTRSTDG